MMQRNHWQAFGLIIAMFAVTRPAAGETLQDAMAAAYGSNPTLLSERARLRATDELVPQALSNWRPLVTVNANAARSNTYSSISSGSALTPSTVGQTQPVAQTFSGTTIYNNETLGVTVTETLYRGGRTTAQTRQAEDQVEAERAQLQVTEQQVLLNVATAYMNLVQAEAVLQLGIHNEQVLQRQLDSVEDRFRVGEVTRTDVAQAQSRLSAAHADRTQYEGNLRTARAGYIQTVGHAPNAVSAPAHLPGVPDSFETAQTGAAADNPQIRNAHYTFEAAVAGVDLIAGELQPTVQVSGTATRIYNYDGPQSLENVAQVVLGVTVPLYQQGQEYSRLRGQKETVGQLQSSLDQARRDVAETTAAAWESLQTGHVRRASYQDQIAAAEIALEGVQRESQVGSRTVLDVLNAEQELLTAQVNAVQAQHDEIVAAYQLLSATGHLTADRLGLAVDLYDPTRHYDEVRGKWVGFGDMPEPTNMGK